MSKKSIYFIESKEIGNQTAGNLSAIMAYLFEGDFMKKFIPFVLFCGLLLSTLFLGCEPATSPKDEPAPTPNPVEKTLTSIYVSKQPDKTNYEYNSLLDLTGLVVKGNYSDNSLEVLEGWTSEPKAGSKLTTPGTD